MKYRKLTPEELKELQDHLFQFLCEFDEFCQKYNINYLLCGGNILGAVRNQDFIPWDDDIDIMLTPEEINKFTALSNHFPKHWRWRIIPALDHVIKLYSKKFYIYTEGSKHTIIKAPIWIDFFPMIEKGVSGVKAKNLLNLLHERKSYPALHWKRFIPHWFRKSIRKKAFELFSIDTEKPIIWCHQNIDYTFPSLPYDCLFPIKRKYKIRNRTFPGPCDAKKYLTAEYGSDYMTPPPPEKQHWHCFTIEE